jgi:hypothetical protein
MFALLLIKRPPGSGQYSLSRLAVSSVTTISEYQLLFSHFPAISQILSLSLSLYFSFPLFPSPKLVSRANI